MMKFGILVSILVIALGVVACSRDLRQAPTGSLDNIGTGAPFNTFIAAVKGKNDTTMPAMAPTDMATADPNAVAMDNVAMDNMAPSMPKPDHPKSHTPVCTKALIMNGTACHFPPIVTRGGPTPMKAVAPG